MSRLRNYWYGIAKKMTSRYYELDNGIEQERIFNNAVTAAIKQTEQSGVLAGEKLKAVKYVLLDQRFTIQGAALKLNYSEFTVQKWLNEFINLVGMNAGYRDIEAKNEAAQRKSKEETIVCACVGTQNEQKRH